MKIYIKTEEGKRFFIPAPMWLVKCALGLGGVGTAIAKKYVSEDDLKYVESVDFKELRKGFGILQQYKGLKLLEVKSSDGTEVTIIV